MIVLHLKEMVYHLEKLPGIVSIAYTVAIVILMDPDEVLVNLFCIILSIRFSLEVEFCFR